MRRLRMIVGAVGGLLCTQPSWGFSPKISPTLQKEIHAGSSEFSAIVMLAEQADLEPAAMYRSKSLKNRFVHRALVDVAKRSQEDLLAFLDGRSVKYQRFYVTNAVALFGADAELIRAIAARGDVAKIISNPKIRTLPEVIKADLVPKSRLEGVEGGIAAIGADRVWEDFDVRGEGIIVAGQDTGVDWDHPALVETYRGSTDDGVDHDYNWHDAIHELIGGGRNPCGLDSEAPCDDDAHGTHTLGTVIGDDGDGNQIGAAPGAEWIACRNMERGNGTPATYIECFEWFLAPYPYGGDPMDDGDPAKAPHVINNSWGCPPSEGCREAEILPVLESMYAAGIMVVASAGNSGSECDTIDTPSAMHSQTTLSVGAHNHRTGRIASFSSRGPSTYDGMIGPDLTAPGVRVRSSVPGGDYSGTFWSGTSMAGPHVAGAVALLWSAVPELIGQIDETVNILRDTATPKTSSQTCGGVSGDSIPNNTYGYGHLDAYEAVNSQLSR